MTNEKLSVAEVLQRAEMIDLNMNAFETTAPETVRGLGGRDALAQTCEMTCIGPIPRLDAETWERMSREHEENRQHGSTNRGE
jgi:hypothetical protein